MFQFLGQNFIKVDFLAQKKVKVVGLEVKMFQFLGQHFRKVNFLSKLGLLGQNFKEKGNF